jgi:hypothetical protein
LEIWKISLQKYGIKESGIHIGNSTSNSSGVF